MFQWGTTLPRDEKIAGRIADLLLDESSVRIRHQISQWMG
jgi:hypothetical protein